MSWPGITSLGSNGGCYNYAEGWLNAYYTVGGNFPAQEVQAAAVHELGYTIGLNHAGGCVAMQPYLYTEYYTCGVSSPQTDDTNGAAALY